MAQTSEIGGPGSIICADVQLLIYVKLKRTDVTSEKGLLLLMPQECGQDLELGSFIDVALSTP